MAVFTLEALNAGKGDALLIRWGPSPSTTHVAMIDGGPSGTYKGSIVPRLTQLTPPGDLDGGVELAFLAVSHIDDDHINGVLALVNGIRRARDRRDRELASVRHLWHNSFHSLLAFDVLGAMSASLGGTPEAAASALEDAPPKSLAAASYKQGRDLALAGADLQLTVNEAFGGLVVAGERRTVGGMSLKVLAPAKKTLDELAESWPDKFRDPAARAQAVDDPRIENMSSIVFLAEFDDKKMLLTGDVRGDLLLAGLKAAKLVRAGKPLHVELLKMPHHGSAHSTDETLFTSVTADNYVISGNGQHGNPHPDVIQMLYDGTAGRSCTLHVTNWPTSGATLARDVEKARKAENLLRKPPSHVHVKVRRKNQLGIAVDLGEAPRPR
jgi:beta-lactamase superfamily II metal-dependent hydrolase